MLSCFLVSDARIAREWMLLLRFERSDLFDAFLPPALRAGTCLRAYNLFSP